MDRQGPGNEFFGGCGEPRVQLQGAIFFLEDIRNIPTLREENIASTIIRDSTVFRRMFFGVSYVGDCVAGQVLLLSSLPPCIFPALELVPVGAGLQRRGSKTSRRWNKNRLQ